MGSNSSPDYFNGTEIYLLTFVTPAAHTSRKFPKCNIPIVCNHLSHPPHSFLVLNSHQRRGRRVAAPVDPIREIYQTNPGTT